MTFDECVDNLHKGSVVTFKEYVLDRHERKKISIEIVDSLVQEVFPANVTLPRETLERYYGTELDDLDYLQLSTMNCPRVVLSLGINRSNELDIKVIVLNKDFFDMGLQELTISNELNPNNLVEPNYVLMNGAW